MTVLYVEWEEWSKQERARKRKETHIWERERGREREREQWQDMTAREDLKVHVKERYFESNRERERAIQTSGVHVRERDREEANRVFEKKEKDREMKGWGKDITTWEF